ncbi:hypothetical protein [Neptuniibacter sp. QD37_11]|uniref:hypothetical protein n=1 Tax=Neptuniibacter sp. QD37_11 TaxID=3398209 RepID=UPI0039F4653C
MSSVLILCGKTCSGKTFLAQLLKSEFGYEETISTTTRAPRQHLNEIDGVSYHFTDEAHFLELEAKGEMAESFCFTDESGARIHYGTTKEAITQLTDMQKKVVAVLEPEGAVNLHNYCVQNNIPVSIGYLECPVSLQMQRYQAERIHNGNIEFTEGEKKSHIDRLNRMNGIEAMWDALPSYDFYIPVLEGEDALRDYVETLESHAELFSSIEEYKEPLNLSKAAPSSSALGERLFDKMLSSTKPESSIGFSIR